MVDTYVNRSEFIVWLADCSPDKKLRFKIVKPVRLQWMI